MAGEGQITVVGNATAEADLKFTPSGAAVCNWTLACTPRVKDGDDWRDGETTFYRCAAWRQLGESAAETITKGMRLLVHGRLRTRQWETQEGEKRLSVELDVDHVGPELRFATARVQKVSRGQNGGQGGSWGQQGGNGGGESEFRRSGGGTKDSGQGGYDDPSGSAPPAGKNDEDEPPF